MNLQISSGHGCIVFEVFWDMILCWEFATTQAVRESDAIEGHAINSALPSQSPASKRERERPLPVDLLEIICCQWFCCFPHKRLKQSERYSGVNMECPSQAHWGLSCGTTLGSCGNSGRWLNLKAFAQINIISFLP